jgi:hypothetical protein
LLASKNADQIALRLITSQGTASLLLTMHTNHPDGSLPTHRRGTLRGMDAA